MIRCSGRARNRAILSKNRAGAGGFWRSKWGKNLVRQSDFECDLLGFGVKSTNHNPDGIHNLFIFHPDDLSHWVFNFLDVSHIRVTTPLEILDSEFWNPESQSQA